MIIVKASREREWVCGVFRQGCGGEVDAYLARCREQQPGLSFWVEEALVHSFPLFILVREVHRGPREGLPDLVWTFHSEKDARSRVSAIPWEETEEDDERIFATVYRVRGPWQPPHDKAGLNYIGGLESKEITGSDLRYIDLVGDPVEPVWFPPLDMS